MAALNKIVTLEKGQKFLRISNSNPGTSKINIARIEPHSEVYDGYELLVLLERPTTLGGHTTLSGVVSGNLGWTPTLINNIVIPSRLIYDTDIVNYINIITLTQPELVVENIVPVDGITQVLNKEKLFRLIWDGKLSVWRIISTVMNEELS